MFDNIQHSKINYPATFNTSKQLMNYQINYAKYFMIK